MSNQAATPTLARTWRRRLLYWLGGGVLAIFFVIGIWSDHELQELDLSNFEFRTSRCVFGIRFPQESHTLPFAKYVSMPQTEQKWVTVHTRSWGSQYSPYYRYGGAVVAIDMFCTAVQMSDHKPSPADVQATANKVAILLRRGDVSAAKEELMSFAMTTAAK